MPNFCGQCGSPLNPKTGKCPKCLPVETFIPQSKPIHSQSENKVSEKKAKSKRNVDKANTLAKKPKSKKKTTVTLIILGIICFLLMSLGVLLVFDIVKLPDSISDALNGIDGEGFGDYLQGEDENATDVSDLNYRFLDDGTVEITGYTGNVDAVYIPSKIDGKAVTSIGYKAFEYCTSTSITIPDSVSIIDEFAFMNCGNLVNVDLSDSVTVISNSAFTKCSALESITIPRSVTKIGDNVFEGCVSLEDITVDSDNSYYFSQNGVLLSKDGTKLITCPMGKKGAYTIPSSVTEISESAFCNCVYLTSITLSDKTEKMCTCSFDNCSGLTSVSIPDTVTEIEDCAFRGCDSLENVYYSGTEKQWNTISIGDDNTDLTEADIQYNYSRENNSSKTKSSDSEAESSSSVDITSSSRADKSSDTTSSEISSKTSSRTSSATSSTTSSRTSSTTSSTTSSKTSSMTSSQKTYKSYKEAYEEFMKEMINGDQTGTSVFYIAYVDNDDIPELFVTEGVGFNLSLYTYYEGEVVDLGSFGNAGNVMYIPKKNLMLNARFGGTGIVESYGYTEIRDGVRENVFGYSQVYDISGNIIYYVDQKEVSESEYKKAAEKYSSGYNFVHAYNGKGYDINESNIEKFVENPSAFINPDE